MRKKNYYWLFALNKYCILNTFSIPNTLSWRFLRWTLWDSTERRTNRSRCGDVHFQNGRPSCDRQQILQELLALTTSWWEPPVEWQSNRIEIAVSTESRLNVFRLVAIISRSQDQQLRIGSTTLSTRQLCSLNSTKLRNKMHLIVIATE